MTYCCAYCGGPVKQQTGSINRALKAGKPLYCDRTCAGLGRRKGKTPEQKKADKAAYDAKRREERAEELKREKAAYHKRTYDPAKAAVRRKQRAHLHAEYCRQPEYREWKRQYDHEHRAKKQYGEFWEAFIALMLVEKEVSERITRQQIYQINDTLNKKQRRRRDYERTYCNNVERCTLD